jgi:hypothetical protein
MAPTRNTHSTTISAATNAGARTMIFNMNFEMQKVVVFENQFRISML